MQNLSLPRTRSAASGPPILLCSTYASIPSRLYIPTIDCGEVKMQNFSFPEHITSVFLVHSMLVSLHSIH